MLVSALKLGAATSVGADLIWLLPLRTPLIHGFSKRNAQKNCPFPNDVVSTAPTTFWNQTAPWPYHRIWGDASSFKKQKRSSRQQVHTKCTANVQCKCVKRWYNWVYKAHVLKSTILRSHLGNLVRPRGKFKPIQALFVCPPFGTSGSCSYYSWVWPVQRTTNEDLDSQSRVLRECGGDIIFKLHHGVYANTQTLCDNECLFFLCVCVCLCRSGTWFDDFVECHYQLHVSVRRPVPSTTNISESSTWNIDPAACFSTCQCERPGITRCIRPVWKRATKVFELLTTCWEQKSQKMAMYILICLCPTTAVSGPTCLDCFACCLFAKTVCRVRAWLHLQQNLFLLLSLWPKLKQLNPGAWESTANDSNLKTSD